MPQRNESDVIYYDKVKINYLNFCDCANKHCVWQMTEHCKTFLLWLQNSVCCESSKSLLDPTEGGRIQWTLQDDKTCIGFDMQVHWVPMFCLHRLDSLFKRKFCHHCMILWQRYFGKIWIRMTGRCCWYYISPTYLPLTPDFMSLMGQMTCGCQQ